MHLSKKLFLNFLFTGLVAVTATSAASAQTVSIVSGDGQVAVQNNIAQGPMIVVVKSFSGQPVAGATVTWSLNGQGSLLSQPNSSTTDANGMSSNQFLGGTLFGVSFTQSIVTATAFGSSVNFTQTTSGQDPVSLLIFVQANVNYPGLGQTLSGSAGSIGTTPVQVQVNAVGPSGAQGVPNVLIHLYPSGTTLSATAPPVLPSGPQIACAGSSGYTNSSGVANCLPVFSGSNGSSSFTVDVGGAFRTFGPFGFTVTQSTVATFRLTGGNNQSGVPGSKLALPLTAQAEDINGNPLPNVPVTWQALTPNATITSSSSASDSNGNVSASVTLGTTVGSVQIQLTSSQGGTPLIFTEQVAQAVTGVTKSAGDLQTAIINTPFAQPLVVQVNTAQGPAAGVPVQFSGPNVTFPQGAAATTGANGQTSVTVQAGASAGAATVTANAGGFSATFTLTIALPGPQITLSSFFNAAGGLASPGGVSPSALVEINGPGIATGLQGCVDGSTGVGPLQLLVSNVTVEFTGTGGYQQYAPIFTVCNTGGQQYVIAQVPTDLPLGAASVTVNAPSGSKTVNNVPVTPVSPGVFQTMMTDNALRAVLQHVSDGSFVEIGNEAHAGETLRAFVTGLGKPVSQSGVAIPTNDPGIPSDPASPQNPILVGVGNEGANLISVVYSPDQVGVYIVTFQVPSDIQPGANVNFGVAAVLNGTPQFGNPSLVPIK